MEPPKSESPISWEQTTVEFTVDEIGSHNPEEELGSLV